MPAMPAVLVIHGITMSGPSMLRLLGPIADALRLQGLELVAPNAGVRLGDDAMKGLLGWLDKTYAARGQQATDFFNPDVFWEAEGSGAHYDWFASSTVNGQRIYAGLEPGLANIREAIAGKEIVGVVGFSQGCAMAGLVAGLAKAGHLPFGDSLRFAVLLSGFKPEFDEPAFDPSPWPVRDLPALFAWGREDPVFPDEATIRKLAAEFTDPEVHIIDDLSHTVPQGAAWTERIAAFVRAQLGGASTSA